MIGLLALFAGVVLLTKKPEAKAFVNDPFKAPIVPNAPNLTIAKTPSQMRAEAQWKQVNRGISDTIDSLYDSYVERHYASKESLIGLGYQFVEHPLLTREEFEAGQGQDWTLENAVRVI